MWTPDALADYLRDPQTEVAKVPRLKAYKGKYYVDMPAFDKPVAERKTLAEWLIRVTADKR